MGVAAEGLTAAGLTPVNNDVSLDDPTKIKIIPSNSTNLYEVVVEFPDSVEQESQQPLELAVPEGFSKAYSHIASFVGKPEGKLNRVLVVEVLSENEIKYLNQKGYSINKDENGRFVVYVEGKSTLPDAFSIKVATIELKNEKIGWARNLAQKLKNFKNFEATYQGEQIEGWRAAITNVAKLETKIGNLMLYSAIPIVGKIAQQKSKMSQFGEYTSILGGFKWGSYYKVLSGEDGLPILKNIDLSKDDSAQMLFEREQICKRMNVPYTGPRAIEDKSSGGYKIVKTSRLDAIKQIFSSKQMLLDVAYTGTRTGITFGLWLASGAQMIGNVASGAANKVAESSLVQQLANSRLAMQGIDMVLTPAYSVINTFIRSKSEGLRKALQNSFAAAPIALLSSTLGTILGSKFSYMGMENAMDNDLNAAGMWIERAGPRMGIRSGVTAATYGISAFLLNKWVNFAGTEEESNERASRSANYMVQLSGWMATFGLLNRVAMEIGAYEGITGDVSGLIKENAYAHKLEAIANEKGITTQQADEYLHQMTGSVPAELSDKYIPNNGSGGKGASVLDVETPAETIIGAVNNAKQNTNTRGPGTFFNRMTDAIRGTDGSPERPGRDGGVQVDFTDKDWLDGGKERQAAIPVAEGLIQEMRSDPDKFIADYNLSGQVSAGQLQNQTTQESIALAMSARVIQGHSGSSLYNDLIKTAPDASQVEKILADFREDLRLGADNKILEEPINLNLQNSSTGELIAGSNRYTGAIGKFSYSSPITPPVATSGTGGTGGHVTPPAPSGVEISISSDVASSLQSQGLIDSDNIIEIVKVAGGNEQIRIVDSTGTETLLPFSQVPVNGSFQPMSSTGMPVTTPDIIEISGILISKSSGEQVGFKGTSEEIYWYAQSGSNDFLVKQSDLLDGNNIVTSYDRNDPTRELDLKYQFNLTSYTEIAKINDSLIFKDGISTGESETLKTQLIAYGEDFTSNGITYRSITIGGVDYYFDSNASSNLFIQLSDVKAIDVGTGVIPRTTNTFLADQLVFANSKINSETDVVVVGAGGAEFANIIKSDKDGGLFVEINGDYFDSNLSTSPRPTFTDGTGTYIEYSGNLFLIKEGKFEVKGNLTENGFEIKDGALQRVSTPTPAAPTSEPTEAPVQPPTATTPAPTVQATTPVPTTEPVTQAPTNTLTPVPSNTATNPIQPTATTPAPVSPTSTIDQIVTATTPTPSATNPVATVVAQSIPFLSSSSNAALNELLPLNFSNVQGKDNIFKVENLPGAIDYSMANAANENSTYCVPVAMHFLTGKSIDDIETAVREGIPSGTFTTSFIRNNTKHDTGTLELFGSNFNYQSTTKEGLDTTINNLLKANQRNFALSIPQVDSEHAGHMMFVTVNPDNTITVVESVPGDFIPGVQNGGTYVSNFSNLSEFEDSVKTRFTQDELDLLYVQNQPEVPTAPTETPVATAAATTTPNPTNTPTVEPSASGGTPEASGATAQALPGNSQFMLGQPPRLDIRVVLQNGAYVGMHDAEGNQIRIMPNGAAYTINSDGYATFTGTLFDSEPGPGIGGSKFIKLNSEPGVYIDGGGNRYSEDEFNGTTYIEPENNETAEIYTLGEDGVLASGSINHKNNLISINGLTYDLLSGQVLDYRSVGAKNLAIKNDQIYYGVDPVNMPLEVFNNIEDLKLHNGDGIFYVYEKDEKLVVLNGSFNIQDAFKITGKAYKGNNVEIVTEYGGGAYVIDSNGKVLKVDPQDYESLGIGFDQDENLILIQPVETPAEVTPESTAQPTEAPPEPTVEPVTPTQAASELTASGSFDYDIAQKIDHTFNGQEVYQMPDNKVYLADGTYVGELIRGTSKDWSFDDFIHTPSDTYIHENGQAFSHKVVDGTDYLMALDSKEPQNIFIYEDGDFVTYGYSNKEANIIFLNDDTAYTFDTEEPLEVKKAGGEPFIINNGKVYHRVWETNFTPEQFNNDFKEIDFYFMSKDGRIFPSDILKYYVYEGQVYNLRDETLQETVINLSDNEDTAVSEQFAFIKGKSVYILSKSEDEVNNVVEWIDVEEVEALEEYGLSVKMNGDNYELTTLEARVPSGTEEAVLPVAPTEITPQPSVTATAEEVTPVATTPVPPTATAEPTEIPTEAVIQPTIPAATQEVVGQNAATSQNNRNSDNSSGSLLSNPAATGATLGAAGVLLGTTAAGVVGAKKIMERRKNKNASVNKVGTNRFKQPMNSVGNRTSKVTRKDI